MPLDSNCLSLSTSARCARQLTSLLIVFTLSITARNDPSGFVDLRDDSINGSIVYSAVKVSFHTLCIDVGADSRPITQEGDKVNLVGNIDSLKFESQADRSTQIITRKLFSPLQAL